MKILILVVCAEWEEHPMLVDAIRETWGKNQSSVWYLWANNHRFLKYHDWVGKMWEGYGAMLHKVLDFLEDYHEWYDYMIKTNTGSYINIPALKEWLEDKPRVKFYAGAVGNISDPYGMNVDFVSGSGIILSNDLCQMMLHKRKEFGPEHIDDVAIGLFMQRHGIPITHGQRTEDLNESSYHYRLRSPDGERFRDAEDMKWLHNKFNPI